MSNDEPEFDLAEGLVAAIAGGADTIKMGADVAADIVDELLAARKAIAVVDAVQAFADEVLGKSDRPVVERLTQFAAIAGSNALTLITERDDLRADLGRERLARETIDRALHDAVTERDRLRGVVAELRRAAEGPAGDDGDPDDDPYFQGNSAAWAYVLRCIEEGT